jgi:hypothetical protein
MIYLQRRYEHGYLLYSTLQSKPWTPSRFDISLSLTYDIEFNRILSRHSFVMVEGEEVKFQGQAMIDPPWRGNDYDKATERKRKKAVH